MNELAQLAIVTGTSRGLGAALAEALLDRGWHVVGIARSPAADRVAEYERFVQVQGDLSALPLDAAKLEAHIRAQAERLAPLGRIGLVNNAGTLSPLAPVHRCDPEELVRAATLGVAAPIWLMGVATRLAGSASLRIVNISSGAATNPYPGWSSYCAGKAAQRIAGQVLSVEATETPELEGLDAAVIDYAPGILATEMQAQIRASDSGAFPRQQKFVEYYEQGQLVEPALPAREIAGLLESDNLATFTVRRYGAPQ